MSNGKKTGFFKGIFSSKDKQEAAEAKQTLQKDQAKNSFSPAKDTNKSSGGCPYKDDTLPADPCYLHHMHIKETWPDTREETKEKKKGRDPVEIDRDIAKLHKAQENAQYELDNAALDEAVDYERASRRLNAEILDFQKQILDLEMERMEALADLSPFKPPSGVREFTIVDFVPAPVKDKIERAEIKLGPLREKLNAAIREWYDIHLLHEGTKAELMNFAKKKDELGARRSKARAEYELARRKKKAAEDKEKQEASKKSGSEGKAKPPKKSSRLTKAEQEEKKAKDKFDRAQQEYSQFAMYEYGRLNTQRKEQLQKLVARLKEIQGITKEIVTIETEAQAARNTLPSGATIQMIAYWKGKDPRSNESGDGKAPTLSISIDRQTRLFREGKGDYCKDNPPKRNGPKRHPYLKIEEDVDKARLEAEQGKPAELKIYEAHRNLLGTGNKLTAFLEIFRHIFSVFPKKRNYTIVGNTCGFDPSGYKVPATLETNIEVFPADSYKLTLKSQPGLGIDAQREEKQADQTKTSSEEGQTAAENAASKEDHIVNTSFSVSALGVTQYSYSESRVTGADGRDIKTVSTMQRDGVFGTATMDDRATGTLQKDTADSGPSQYDSHLVRSAETDWFVEDTQGQVASMDEQWSKDGSTSVETKSGGGRVPAMGSKFMPQIPVDLVLTRNGIEDPVSEQLRRSLGLIVYMVKKTAEISSRIGNLAPSMGWKFGFSAAFLTGSLGYMHEYKEHNDYRVWLHRQFDMDLNLVSLRIFIFGGAALEGIFWVIQAGIEAYIKGSIGIKGSFENTHPDADTSVDIGFGPTGSIGAGIEAKAIVGQPDWFIASGSIETTLSAEGVYWAKKSDSQPYLECKMKWEGIVAKGVAHVILVGHWEGSYKLCDERELYSGRFPEELDIDTMLEEQNKSMERSKRQAIKEAAQLDKKLARKKGK